MRPRLRLATLAIGLRLPRRTVRLRLTTLYAAMVLLSGAVLLVIADTLVAGNSPAGSAVPARGHPPAYDPAHLTPPQHAAEVSNLLVVSAIALGIMAVVSVVLGWVIAGRVLRPLRAMTAAARRISEDNLHERLAVPGPADELKDLGDTIDGLLERLEEAFAAQRRFVANASHELRTPLALARTLLQMTLTDPQPTIAAFRETCEEVLTAGEQQEQLIEALLTLARSQRGLDHRDTLDLADIANRVVHAREAEAASRGLAIGTAVTATPVRGDARLLERLVANLVDNALRHNVPDGRLDIQVAVSSGQPALKITNTGPVIPAGQASRLLQPFERLPATGRSADDEGLGLGLSIVAAIVRAHRAALTAKPGTHGGLDIEIGFPAVASQAAFPPGIR